MTQVCANPACSNPVTPFKVHGQWEYDPYCSTVCCKAAHMVRDSTDKPDVLVSTARTHCAGCGVPLGEYTHGCAACGSRRRKAAA